MQFEQNRENDSFPLDDITKLFVAQQPTSYFEYPEENKDDCIVKNAKPDTKRRSNYENEGRDFKCKECDKAYLSYPALYTHMRQKHSSLNSKHRVIRNRGRPRKNPQQNLDPKIEATYNEPNPVDPFLFQQVCQPIYSQHQQCLQERAERHGQTAYQINMNKYPIYQNVLQYQNDFAPDGQIIPYQKTVAEPYYAPSPCQASVYEPAQKKQQNITRNYIIDNDNQFDQQWNWVENNSKYTTECQSPNEYVQEPESAPQPEKIQKFFSQNVCEGNFMPQDNIDAKVQPIVAENDNIEIPEMTYQDSNESGLIHQYVVEHKALQERFLKLRRRQQRQQKFMRMINKQSKQICKKQKTDKIMRLPHAVPEVQKIAKPQTIQTSETKRGVAQFQQEINDRKNIDLSNIQVDVFVEYTPDALKHFQENKQ